MRIRVVIGNPEHGGRAVTTDASSPLPTIPSGLFHRLRLPLVENEHAYASFEVRGRSVVSSVRVVKDGPHVVLGLSTLTGLFLHVNPQTGSLEEFEPTLL